ncbi:MAG: hypothetical protein M1326_05975 [Cyanobacteria bacterium]|nr:hypothetical protein [Cyanobacteriota bacterium]
MSGLWLEIFLGNVGKYIVLFIDNYYIYFVPLIFAYGIFMTISSYNLKRIEKRVVAEIINQAKKIIKESPSINFIDLTDKINIDWEKIWSQYSFFPFISQESGLWVNRSNIINIRENIMHNERKIHLVLERHGIKLQEEKSDTRKNLYLEYIHRLTKK